MKKELTLIVFLLALFCHKSFSQISYPCGVYFIGMNGTSSNGGEWNQVYNSPDITLAAWMQLTDSTYIGHRMDIFNRYDFSTTENLDFSLSINEAGDVVFRSRVIGGTQYYDSLLFNLKPKVGIWYHVAVTFNGNGNLCSAYVNGQPASSKTFNGAISYINIGSAFSHYMTFGLKDGQNAGYSNFFKGYLDEAVYCQKALTASQVLTLAAGINPGDPFIKDNSVAVYHKFDDYPGQPNYGTYGGTLTTGGQYYYCPSSNKPPVANAGFDQTILLPTNSVTLNGTASDEDGSVEDEVWSKISGPFGGSITNSHNPSTTVENLQEGTYVFRLTVTDDKGAMGFDDVTIIVKKLMVKILDPRSQNVTIIDPNYANNGIIKKDLTMAYYKNLDERIGGCADGVTKLLIVIDTNTTMKFELSPDYGTLSSLDAQDLYSRNNEMEIAPDPQEKKVFAIYYLPNGKEFNAQDADPVEINLKVSISNNLSVFKLIPIKLLQLPVVLIHGEWGSPSDWQQDINNLKTNGFKVTIADYKINRTASFEDDLFWHLLVAPFLNNAISKAVNDYRSEKIAATQVDIVAHAGGGLHARLLAKQLNYLNYFKGPIHKLITLGTPHYGNPIGPILANASEGITKIAVGNSLEKAALINNTVFANLLKDNPSLLTKLEYEFPDILDKIESGFEFVEAPGEFVLGQIFKIWLKTRFPIPGSYHEDLDPNGKVIKELSEIHVDVHTIGANYKTSGNTNFNAWNTLIKYFSFIAPSASLTDLFNQDEYEQKVKSYIENRGKDLNAIYNNQDNDVFVPINSGTSGFSDTKTFDIFSNTVNSDIVKLLPPSSEGSSSSTLLDRSDIRDRIKALLLSTDPNDFADHLPNPGRVGTNSERLTRIETSDSLIDNFNINLFDSSYVALNTSNLKSNYVIGENSNVEIGLNIYNGAKIGEAFLYVENVGIFEMLKNEGYVVNFNLPDNIRTGILNMAVLAFSDSGMVYSDTCSIRVQNDKKIDSLYIFPASVNLDSSLRQTSLEIMGFVNNSGAVSAINLNSYFETLADPGSPIFTMSPDGLIIAKQPGLDSILITIDGLQKYVLIRVDSNFNQRSYYPSEIEFPQMPDIELRLMPISLKASSTSGENVIFSVQDSTGPLVVQDNLAFFRHPGKVTIKASSLGNSYFSDPPDLVQTFCINPVQPPAIVGDTIVSIGTKKYALLKDSLLNYTWSVSGGVILEESKDSITINWQAAGEQTLKVVPSIEGCVGKSRDLVVRVNSALPLNLIDFSVSLQNEETILTWQTSQEINTTHFIIERSGDGETFSPTGKVDAAGNSPLAKDYSFTDTNPLHGINYYRLKIVDKDGTFTYSKVVVVKNDNHIASFKIFPNPANNILYIEAKGIQGMVTIRVFDANGRRLKMEKAFLSDNNPYLLNIKNLPKGVYQLMIQNGTKLENLKFIRE